MKSVIACCLSRVPLSFHDLQKLIPTATINEYNEACREAGYMETSSDYPKAGQHAPPEVQQAIAAYLQNPKPDVPLLYAILGSGTPPYKMSPETANYQTQPHDDQKCGNCRFAYQKVITGKYICSQIRGKIEPNAWCRLWRGGAKLPESQESELKGDVEEPITTESLNRLLESMPETIRDRVRRRVKGPSDTIQKRRRTPEGHQPKDPHMGDRIMPKRAPISQQDHGAARAGLRHSKRTQAND